MEAPQCLSLFLSHTQQLGFQASMGRTEIHLARGGSLLPYRAITDHLRNIWVRLERTTDAQTLQIFFSLTNSKTESQNLLKTGKPPPSPFREFQEGHSREPRRNHRVKAEETHNWKTQADIFFSPRQTCERWILGTDFSLLSSQLWDATLKSKRV